MASKLKDDLDCQHQGNIPTVPMENQKLYRYILDQNQLTYIQYNVSVYCPDHLDLQPIFYKPVRYQKDYIAISSSSSPSNKLKTFITRS